MYGYNYVTTVNAMQPHTDKLIEEIKKEIAKDEPSLFEKRRLFFEKVFIASFVALSINILFSSSLGLIIYF